MHRNFVSIPRIPDLDNPGLQAALEAMRENIELLAGLRGSNHNHAIVRGDIETGYPTAASVDALYTALNDLLTRMKP